MTSHPFLNCSTSSLQSYWLPLQNPSLSRSSTRHGSDSLVVKATDIVLVDKSDAEASSRLKTTYLNKIVPLLKEEFSYTNTHQVPKIEKVVVNCGIGDAAQNAKGLDAAVNELALIVGQRPVKTRAKDSIAIYKIREGQPLGIAVTLRGNLMYSFLDRLINLALPRMRDFQGLKVSSFDGNGNFCLGVQEQSVFPEIKYDVLGKTRGMDICISTTAETDKEAHKLLALMGMPFREDVSVAILPRKKKFKRHHFDVKGKNRK